MTEKKQKKKAAIPRQAMPEQAADIRRHNFNEVPLGYTEELAQIEASRCLQCRKPGCVDGCPVEVEIPGFINLISEGDFTGAIRNLWSKNTLPAVCGRVCPQETLCEEKCIVGKKGGPVAIGNLERFCADYEREYGTGELPRKSPPTGKRVAVVGSGPSGLTVAGDLIVKGHEVTVFEASHKPGGVLVYGISEFRLPKSIVAQEVNFLERLGVKVECNAVVGQTVSLDELFKEGYDAIFLALEAELLRFMNIPGENLIGILSANEYLTRANLMKVYQFPKVDAPIPRGKNVVVLGAGNVAMDSARTAMRLAAENVSIIYRCSNEEIPARAEEIRHAKEEGIKFELLTYPIKYLGNEKGHLTGMTCLRMKLSEPDGSGRRRPVPIEASEFDIETDLCIVAVRSGAISLLPQLRPDMKLNQWGYIRADPESRKTPKKAVWAGGDIVTGAATVILAMGAGRKAADSIHKYLTWGW